jgi:hypothetical protein
MKSMKSALFLLLCGVFSFVSNAQTYKKGTILVDAYYGFPDFSAFYLKNQLTYHNTEKEGASSTSPTTTEYNLSSFSNFKVKSFGPLGFHFEVLVSKKIGIGLHINYAATAVEARETNTVYQTVYDSVGTGSTTSPKSQSYYDWKMQLNRFRFMPTFNLHLGKSKRIDPYLLAGIGILITKYHENKGGSRAPDLFGNDNILFLPPICLRVAFGVRYYLSDVFGVHGEIGIGGGPFLQAGISCKFNTGNSDPFDRR